jgi:hypothetical protein
MKSEKIPARYLVNDENGKPVWMTNIHSLTESELAQHEITDFDEKEDISEELRWITELLEEARKYELEGEVIQFALKTMKEDPRLSPAQAFVIGYQEWVK